MKKKTIELTIKAKINAWKKTIIDYSKTDKSLNHYAKLADGIEKYYIVTGGSIVSMLLQEEPNDFDVYFSNAEFCKELAEYYVSKLSETDKDNVYVKIDEKDPTRVRTFIRSNGILRAKKKPDKGTYLPIAITDNAVTLSDGIQFITRFTGSPEEIHKNFDFAHVKSYMTSKGLVLDTFAMQCILTKELKYIGSRYPLSSIIRTRKFIKRGWTCGASEYLKMIYDVSNLDLNSVEVLKDQLIGVDVLHFNALISKLKANPIPEDPKIFRPYLFDLINDIFDASDPDHEHFEDGE
jgi:hypothetical protein